MTSSVAQQSVGTSQRRRTRASCRAGRSRYVERMLLVAHRTPVGTVEAQRLATAGATVFETDVQLRTDHIAVSHFAPIAGACGRLQHDNWRFRWHPPPGGDPRLDVVIAVIPPNALILLDLKETAPARRSALIETIIAQDLDRSRYRVSSAQVEDLARCRSAGFGTWRTIGDRRDLADALRGERLPDQAVTVRHSLVDATVTRRLHNVVATVVVWTVNEVDRALRLRDYGVDGVTTDNLAVLRALSV